MEQQHLVAAIQNLNLVQAQPELKQLRSGEETKLYEAVENKKIIKSSIDDIKGVLRNVMVKVGLRANNWPSEEEKAILIEFIVKNFGGHTCEEVLLAFEMALTGKLNLEENEIPCYENFSCIYFAKIMNAYREWSKLAIHHKPTSATQIENKKEFTDKEMREWINDWRELIKTIQNPTLIPESFYGWLVAHAAIRLTINQMYDCLDKAVSIRQLNLIEQYKSEGEHGESAKLLAQFNEMRSQRCLGGNEVEIVKTLARKVAVMEYLKNNTYATNQ